MSCRCSLSPLCQFCKATIHACREIWVPYAEKRYHLLCWEKLERVAVRTGGAL